MSSYRDDTQETAVASDSTWGQLTTLAEETVKIASTLIFGLLLTIAESAVASDQVIDNTRYLVVEQAAISDTALDKNNAAALVLERTKVSDSIISLNNTSDLCLDQAAISDVILDHTRFVVVETSRITDVALSLKRSLFIANEQAKIRDSIFSLNHALDLQTDSLKATDQVFDKVRSVVTDKVAINDVVFGVNHTSTNVSEKGRVSDNLLSIYSGLTAESLSVADQSIARLLRRESIFDSLVIADQAIDVYKPLAILVDSAAIESFATGHLVARNMIVEDVLIEDDQIGGYFSGQAWTANTDTWAMSRYAPYTFNSLSVINGALYGIADDGIYAINGGEPIINGVLTTGKIDLSVNGDLVHPLAAYLEYELSGANKTAQMDVTTTQSGLVQTYTYILPTEKADYLTNGRIVFGRGLRGRHFTFSLRLNGTRGYINDLSVELAQTKRRV